MIYNNPLKMDG